MEGRSTGTGLLEEPVENSDDKNFRAFDVHPNLGLGEEPGSLLNYLPARCNRVMKSRLYSMRGPSLRMEMLIHNSLIFQVDCELTRHQWEVSSFMDIASTWID